MPDRDQPQQRLRLVVSGLVQGVGFRYFSARMAQRLNLVGWVRNLPSGEVEIEAQGEPQDLDDFLQLIRRGAPGSEVHAVREDWLPAQELADTDFRVRLF